MRKAILLIFIVALAYAPAAAQAEYHLSREELQADISETYELLKRYQPNLTAHKSPAELDRLYNRLLQETREENTVFEAYLALTELIGAVCDEHTQLLTTTVDFPDVSGGWPWFEYPLLLRGGKLFMEDLRDGTKHEILSIGEHTGSDVAAGIAARQPNDGCLKDGTLDINERLPLNSNLLRSIIGWDGPYIVRSRQENTPVAESRILKEANLDTRNRRFHDFQNKRSAALARELLLAGFLREFLGPELENAGLDYWYSSRQNIAYLGINSFDSYDQSAAGFDRVMRDVISNKKPDALIIDLTKNPGGWTKTSQLLVAYLTPQPHRLHSKTYMKTVSTNHPESFTYFDKSRQDQFLADASYFRKIRPTNGIRTTEVRRRSFGKPDYKGKIYVLLSPRSRSNAFRVASTLKRLRNATIVGVTTANFVVSYCDAANGEFALANTGFLLRIPDRCYHAEENRFRDDGTLVPDLRVNPLDWPLVELNANILKAALEDIGRSSSN